MPCFSIVIPTYNRAHMLPKALESVYHQTFPDWECIIVDDGSTDNTKEIVQKWTDRDNRFRYIYQQNAERSAARNKGIENAKGEWICFLDSDDYFLPERLCNIYDYMKKMNFPQIMLFTDIGFNENNLIVTRTYDDIPSHKEALLNYLSQTVIGVPQVCISKEILFDEKFNDSITIGEDFELWLRINAKYNIKYQKNNLTIIANEHPERSVNLKCFDSPKKLLQTYKIAFHKEHPGSQIRVKNKRKLISTCYFNSAKHHMFNQRYYQALFLTVKSIITCLRTDLTKHKLYCALFLTIGKIPQQYNIKNI